MVARFRSCCDYHALKIGFLYAILAVVVERFIAASKAWAI